MTTTTLPRPIAREDIRVGDRIRAEWTACGVERTSTGTVDSIDAKILRSADGGYIGWIGGSPDAGTYTLLDRPAPALPTEPGSVILASRIDDVDYDPPVPLALAYTVRFHHHPWMLLGDRGDRDRWYRPERIKSWVPARIAPTDEPEAAREPRVGDPAGMWTQPADDARCVDSSPILFCSRSDGHDGPHAARGASKWVRGVWE